MNKTMINNFLYGKSTKIFGHHHVVDSLLNAYNANRFPHALLFSGMQGVGKSTFALHIANALIDGNFPNIGNTDYVVSGSANLVFSGVHPDCTLLSDNIKNAKMTSKGAISMGMVKSVVRFFSLTSQSNNWRIAIFDSIDNVTRADVNVLLKVLEEPPKKCLLILISHSLASVPDTINSRCNVINFNGLESSEVEKIFPNDSKYFLEKFANITPGIYQILQKLGGNEFYDDFLLMMENVAKNDFRSLYIFGERYVYGNKISNIHKNWEEFWLFLYYWVAYCASDIYLDNSNNLREKKIMQNADCEKVSLLWLQTHRFINEIEIYNLEKKQGFFITMQKFAKVFSCR